VGALADGLEAFEHLDGVDAVLFTTPVSVDGLLPLLGGFQFNLCPLLRISWRSGLQ